MPFSPLRSHPNPNRNRTFGWISAAPKHAGLVELAIFKQTHEVYADPRALLALMVREAALFTPELRSQIFLLLP